MKNYFCLKVKDFKLKQSWKRVYAKDPDMVIKNERTFHMDDEEKTEVDRDDIVEGELQCLCTVGLFRQ